MLKTNQIKMFIFVKIIKSYLFCILCLTIFMKMDNQLLFGKQQLTYICGTVTGMTTIILHLIYFIFEGILFFLK